ncbi:MAG: MG2 domain-containing protein, partial [Pseudomonadota bacterium]
MAKRFTLAAAFFALSLLPPTYAQAERTLERLPGTDLPGFDYRTLRDVPIEACERVCLADGECAAFTYNERANWCFLKSEVGEATPYGAATSAIVRETPDAPPLPTPDLAYVPASLTRDADTLFAEVATVARGGAASARVDPTAASALEGGRTGAWLQFAGAQLTRSRQSNAQRWQAMQTAGAAAIVGLREARTVAEQGAALAILSAVLEAQRLYRPAIFASEASVTLRFDAAEAERLERLRAQHGFRVLDYTVNTELAAPRMCIQFSEPLLGDAQSLQRFVTLDGAADPAITVESRQLCVEGLAHGERYVVGLRDGLPSTVDERLRDTAEFRVYVRDRAPTARFDANDFVLPATAEGVPVVTVNTKELALELALVTDRNLTDTIRRGQFKSQLWRWDARHISEQQGVSVWTGTMPVESRTNEEVRTLVPVGEVIGERQPGVYVLTARPLELPNQNQTVATQWFVVSDLGLSTYSSGGTVDVFARSLETADPLEGVALTLLGTNDEVLAEGLTDADGRARLVSDAPATGGRVPALVTARYTGGDYGFVPLSAGAFELSDRGVKGRAAPGPVDAFLATERGVYRGGETVNLTVLMRDDAADGLNVPVTLKVTRPDGVLSRRLTDRASSAGGLTFALPLTTNAATGTWRVSAHVDPEGPAVGTTTFLVEDFVPQRIEVALETAEASAEVGSSVPLTVAADFLYGAPAAGLMLEGSVLLSETSTLDAYDGYRFGRPEEAIAPQRTPLDGLPRTDESGRASFDADIGTAPDATGPLQARFTVSVREPGGRQVSDALTLPVSTGKPLLGIRPLFDEGRVGEGSTAGFEMIAVGPDGGRIASEAEWTLIRLTRDFQWYRRGGRWSYDAIERQTKVAEGTLAIGAETPVPIEAAVNWGRYRLEVASADGAVASSYNFSAGWFSASADAETPDVLEVHLDRETYAAGDAASLRIVPRAAGKALVTVLGNGVEWAQMVDVPADGTSVEIPVDASWSPGVYVAATLYRDGDVAGGRPLPQRAIGIAHLDVDTAARRLGVSMEVPEIVRPRGVTTIPVAVEGLDPGETAFMTVAAVDVGILN